MSDPVLRRSPLDAAHRALGARMVAFGGWEMPLSYSGVIEEHLACREAAVAFDVSHLGSVAVDGPAAFDVLQRTLSNDLRRIESGRAQYTHLLDVDDAHVVDDIIVWWLEPDHFLVMPNASNTERIVEALQSEASGDLEVEDVTATRAVIAVQGPQARARLRSVWPEASEIGRFRVEPAPWRGASGVVGGTGYTGEDGVEVQVPAEAASELWSAILDAGVAPAGLGARDTLRLEAGLPLHGHELGPGITPLQAGLGWVVGWDKPILRGRAALEAERERGPSRRLVGIVVDGRRPPREGCPIELEGRAVGTITSGSYSPVLERGVGLAYVEAAVADGTRVDVDVRGRLIPATVSPPRLLDAPH